MKFKAGITLIFLAANLNLWGSETPVIACWDHSFAYNNLRMDEVDDGFEVNLSGATLGDLELHSSREVYSSRGWNQDKFMVKFKKDQCQIERDENQVITKISCLNKIKDHKFSHIFVERGLDNLDDFVQIISQFSVDSLQFNLDENKIELAVVGGRFTTEPVDRQIMGFNLRFSSGCNQEGRGNDGGTHWGSGPFPERLRQYLSR